MPQSILSDQQLEIFDFVRSINMKLFGSKEFNKSLSDLEPLLGKALLIGGLAVIHHGYERSTKDMDILYGYRDAKILDRLNSRFQIVLKAQNGWHHLEHKETGIRLELIPEGGLTTYGFIPGPAIVGGENGVISLRGLCWLKLLSGRSQDISDLVNLAKLRMDEMRDLTAKLPEDLQARFTEALDTAQREMDTDPNRHPDSPPPDPRVVQEMTARYGKLNKDSTNA